MKYLNGRLRFDFLFVVRPLLKSFLLRFTTGALILAASYSAHSSSVLHRSPERLAELADAICAGTVIEARSFRHAGDRGIYTETLVRVEQALKGRFPAVIRLVHRGGVLENEGELDGFAPRFRSGEERLLFLSRRADGTLYATQGSPSAVRLQRVRAVNGDKGGLVPQQEQLLEQIRRRFPRPSDAGADVTDQAGAASVAAGSPAGDSVSASATGLLADGSGIPSRFLAPDRGEPIPYLIDVQALPAGITIAQATNAVHNALQAWTAVTSVKFTFEGLQNFGRAAINVITNDSRLRIQLHDLYNAVSGSGTLGLGGRGFSFDDALFPNGGLGGRVGPNEFHVTTRAYVMLKHSASAMQTLATFEEVLCHEIGHSLGMAHSSENPSETNSVLFEAIMYYRAHVDGRGARLSSYDPPVIQQVHPQNDTPPYGYDRVIYCVTSFSPLSHPEVNWVEMKGYDLQNSSLIRGLFNATTFGGDFGLNGDILTYTPANAWSDSPLEDLDGTGYYDLVYVRFDDGANLSPPVLVRVMQYLLDTGPSGSPDGMPDSWMMTHFGSSTPVAGLSRAGDDPDGDGMTNLEEFRAGTNPRSAGSSLKISSFSYNNVQWTARSHELYELQSSTDLTNWSRATGPVVPVTTTGTASGFADPSVGHQFYRIKKAP